MHLLIKKTKKKRKITKISNTFKENTVREIYFFYNNIVSICSLSIHNLSGTVHPLKYLECHRRARLFSPKLTHKLVLDVLNRHYYE